MKDIRSSFMAEEQFDSKGSELKKFSKFRTWNTSLMLPILGGVFLSFAYPRFDFWPLAWLALVPLWIFIDSSKSRWMALLGSFLFSFTFFAISVHWIRFVTLFGWSFVVCFESIFYMAMGLAAWEILHNNSCKVCFRDNLSLLLVLPALWVITEWLRSEIPVMGFGWNLLAYSQTENAHLLQIAKVTGSYGLSFIVALGNAFVFLLWRLLSSRGSAFRRLMILGIACVFFLFILIGVVRYGYSSINQNLSGRMLRVAMVQGNIPQEEKWDPKYKNLIIDKYLKLTDLVNFDGPDLIVWPEAAFPGYFNLDREGVLNRSVRKMGVPLLFGALTAENELRFLNSVYLISANGEVTGRYDKINLVPFGEYMPFHSILFPLDSLAYKLGVSDFSKGKNINVFKISSPKWYQGNEKGEFVKSDGAIGPLVCFENTFQNLVRKMVWNGAQALCVVTNDAWFRESSAPYQHLQASVLRAVETGRWVVHCANTGVSAFISPHGEVTDKIEDHKGQDLFVEGGITRPILLISESTPYLTFGYLFPYIALLIVIQAFLFRKKRIE